MASERRDELITLFEEVERRAREHGRVTKQEVCEIFGFEPSPEALMLMQMCLALENDDGPETEDGLTLFAIEAGDHVYDKNRSRVYDCATNEDIISALKHISSLVQSAD